MVMTARDFVAMAMKELKILPAGDEPEASELADGITVLNAMLRSDQIHSHLWRDETASIVAPALMNEITLPDDVRTVVAVRVLDVGNERQIMLWDRDDYRALPTKGTTGRVVAVAQDRKRDTVSLLLWPVPATDTTIIYDYQRRFVAIVDSTDAIDVPEDYHEAVWTRLAVRMAGMFGAELPPELVSRSDSLMSAFLDDDRPDSYFMGPYDDRYYG